MVLPEGVREDVPAARVGGARDLHVVRACARARGLAGSHGTSPGLLRDPMFLLGLDCSIMRPCRPRPVLGLFETISSRTAQQRLRPSLPSPSGPLGKPLGGLRTRRGRRGAHRAAPRARTLGGTAQKPSEKPKEGTSATSSGTLFPPLPFGALRTSRTATSRAARWGLEETAPKPRDRTLERASQRRDRTFRKRIPPPPKKAPKGGSVGMTRVDTPRGPLRDSGRFGFFGMGGRALESGIRMASGWHPDGTLGNRGARDARTARAVSVYKNLRGGVMFECVGKESR